MTLFAVYWLGVSGICLYADGRDDPNGWLMIAFGWPALPVAIGVLTLWDWMRSRT